jgi:acyl dehydratase
VSALTPKIHAPLVLEECAVGDRLPTLERRIELATLVRYAGASGDFNAIHFDEAFARAAGLDGVIGHGALALGLMSEAVTDWAVDSGTVGELSVRFAGQYRPGDVLTIDGEVTERTTDEDGGVVLHISLTCTNQEGTEVLRDAKATLRPR